MPSTPARLYAFCFALCLIHASACPLSAYAARFVDTDKSWSERSINLLSDKGVIGGENDGKFRPDQPVTRAQLAAWLVKVLGIGDQRTSQSQTFPDVQPSDWFFKPVEIARQNNYISGYTDGFRPNQFMQRAEVISILARTIGASPLNPQQIDSALSRYSDGQSVPGWARTGVAQAALAGILVDKDTTTIHPSAIATRGETAALLASLDDYLSKKEVAQATRSVQPQPPGNQNAYGGPGYPPPYGQNQYSGQVTTHAPPGQGFMPPGTSGQPGNNGSASGPGAGSGPGSSSTGAPPGNGIGSQPAGTGPALQGGVVRIAAGTIIHTNLKNTLVSGTTQAGEEVTAEICAAVSANGQEVIPSGSKLVGSVTSVTSAKRGFGANGKIDMRFTSIETPDGRRIPLSASVDSNSVRLSGGTTAGRIGKSAVTVGAGALGGAAAGTALGAVVGAISGGKNMAQTIGMSALIGTAAGGGIGGVKAGMRKGNEIKLPAGMSLPVRLDQTLTLTSGNPSDFSYSQGNQQGTAAAPQTTAVQPSPGFIPGP